MHRRPRRQQCPVCAVRAALHRARHLHGLVPLIRRHDHGCGWRTLVRGLQVPIRRWHPKWAGSFGDGNEWKLWKPWILLEHGTIFSRVVNIIVLECCQRRVVRRWSHAGVGRTSVHGAHQRRLLLGRAQLLRHTLVVEPLPHHGQLFCTRGRDNSGRKRATDLSDGSTNQPNLHREHARRGQLHYAAKHLRVRSRLL